MELNILKLYQGSFCRKQSPLKGFICRCSSTSHETLCKLCFYKTGNKLKIEISFWKVRKTIFFFSTFSKISQTSFFSRDFLMVCLPSLFESVHDVHLGVSCTLWISTIVIIPQYKVYGKKVYMTYTCGLAVHFGRLDIYHCRHSTVQGT